MAELSLNITVPDEKVVAVIDGLARQNDWTEYIEDENGNPVLNTVTKAQWIKKWILGVVKASWKAWNDAQAVETALENQDEDGSDFE